MKRDSTYRLNTKGNKKVAFWLSPILLEAYNSILLKLDPSPKSKDKPRYNARNQWLAVILEEWILKKQDEFKRETYCGCISSLQEDLE